MRKAMETGQEAAAAGQGSRRKRLDGIDVIRGLAIMNVVLHHTNIRIPFRESPLGALLPQTAVQAIFWTGDFAVKIFFVVSGFLITSSILGRWGELRNTDWKAFYGMRFARIAPCLLALLAILSALHLAALPGFTIDPQRASLPRALLAALTFHINWLEARVGYLPGSWDVLWSLSVEETFYLAYPLLCSLVRNRYVLLGIGLALVVAGPVARIHASNDIWYDYSYLGGMDAIALGCMTAVLARSRWSGRIPGWGLATCGGLLVFAAWFRGLARNLGLLDTGLDVTVLAAGTALVILALSRVESRSAGQGFLGGPWTAVVRWFGRNSYEVYLTHMFVVTWGVQWFRHMGSPIRWAPLWFLGILLAAGLAGAAVARWFSEPMNEALRARLVRKRDGQAA